MGVAAGSKAVSCGHTFRSTNLPSLSLSLFSFSHFQVKLLRSFLLRTVPVKDTNATAVDQSHAGEIKAIEIKCSRVLHWAAPDRSDLQSFEPSPDINFEPNPKGDMNVPRGQRLVEKCLFVRHGCQDCASRRHGWLLQWTSPLLSCCGRFLRF